MIDEGVIKFRAEHTSSAPVTADLALLNGWRSLFFQLGVIGADPARYGGAGFGNVSQRVTPYPGDRGRRAFLVSGTQTGRLPTLAPSHWVKVTAYDPQTNCVTSVGPMLPSSEAMTHGAIYDLSPAIRAVIHVHAPALWENAANLPCTAPDVHYGTPAMAREITRLWRDGPLQDRLIVAMLGHQDGIISFGRTPTEAATTLMTALAGVGTAWRGRAG